MLLSCVTAAIVLVLAAVRHFVLDDALCWFIVSTVILVFLVFYSSFKHYSGVFTFNVLLGSTVACTASIYV